MLMMMLRMAMVGCSEELMMKMMRGRVGRDDDAEASQGLDQRNLCIDEMVIMVTEARMRREGGDGGVKLQRTEKKKKKKKKQGKWEMVPKRKERNGPQFITIQIIIIIVINLHHNF